MSDERSGRTKREEVERIARQTLVDHGLFSFPVNPVVLAKRLGARVVHAVFSEPKYSGLVAKRDNNVTILVKDSDAPVRKRFTVAHEIGHSILHLHDASGEIIDTDADFFRGAESAGTPWTVRRSQEYEANLFAAALLMPAELVREAWMDLPSKDRGVETMAEIFQVSSEAMGYRLDTLGLTNATDETEDE